MYVFYGAQREESVGASVLTIVGDAELKKKLVSRYVGSLMLRKYIFFCTGCLFEPASSLPLPHEHHADNSEHLDPIYNKSSMLTLY
jgi:hypothetical protein